MAYISQGTTDSPAMREGINPSPAPKPVRLIPYDFPLRPDGLRIRAVLPEDLTMDEAERLTGIVNALVMP